MNSPQKSDILVFPKGLSHEWWDFFTRVRPSQKGELHLLLQNKLPALLSHLLVHSAVFLSSASPPSQTCHPSRQVRTSFSKKPPSLGRHLSGSSCLTVLWDEIQYRDALEAPEASSGLTFRLLQSLIPEDIALTHSVPELVLLLISQLSSFLQQHMTPFFYFSNLSGSSHHVKQRSDLAWKKAVNCFL